VLLIVLLMRPRARSGWTGEFTIVAACWEDGENPEFDAAMVSGDLRVGSLQ